MPDTVAVQVDDAGVTITVLGCLDAVVGEELLHRTAAAIDEQPSRLDIDLCSLTGFTHRGADSLAACRDLCADLPDGLHYRTGQGAGRDALLSAYPADDEEWHGNGS